MTTVSELPDLYPGFAMHRLKTSGGEIFARVGGSGPPLVALHGYPQTHVCWHKVAPELAKSHTLVVMDLKGYGASDAPEGDADHVTYSKRAMAKCVVEAMAALGHTRFIAMGHDRGARVAYRLALDVPDAVSALIILDILPTGEVFERMRWKAALTAYHWLFLAQPKPMPETLISASHQAYVDHTLSSWTQSKSLASLDPRALAHYRALMADPTRVHAVCEDYRAGASIDRSLDEADRAAGRKIAAPTLVLWGSDYVGKGAVAPMEVWRAWCTQVEGREINSGHFLAEENPADTLAAITSFLKAQSQAT